MVSTSVPKSDTKQWLHNAGDALKVYFSAVAAPVTVPVAMTADRLAETLSDWGMSRSARVMGKISDLASNTFTTGYDSEPIHRNVARKLGLGTAWLACIGAVAYGVQTAENKIKSPTKEDQVLGVSGCDMPPRIWRDDQGQYKIVVPKDCKLGQ